MAKIVCNFEAGLLLQKVLIYDRPDSQKSNPEVYYMNYSDVSDFIIKEAQNIKDVYLSGIGYLSYRVKEEIEKKEKIYYNNNEEKINIHMI